EQFHETDVAYLEGHRVGAAEPALPLVRSRPFRPPRRPNRRRLLPACEHAHRVDVPDPTDGLSKRRSPAPRTPLGGPQTTRLASVRSNCFPRSSSWAPRAENVRRVCRAEGPNGRPISETL